MLRDLRRRELPRELRQAARPRVLLARVAEGGLGLLQSFCEFSRFYRYEVREGGEVLRGSTSGGGLGAFFGGLLARRLLGRVVAARRALLLLRVARRAPRRGARDGGGGTGLLFGHLYLYFGALLGLALFSQARRRRSRRGCADSFFYYGMKPGQTRTIGACLGASLWQCARTKLCL